MTVTLVYADAGDGGLWSSSLAYETARNGSGITVDTASTVFYVGQSTSPGVYHAIQQGFLSFAWSAVPNTERVTAAALGISVRDIDAPGVTTTIEARALSWTGGGLSAADWKTPAALAGARAFDIFGNPCTEVT